MSGLRYGVLGRITVTRDGAEVQIGGPVPTRLIAALLAAGGHMVPARRLVHDIWGEHAPATAAGTLQGYVARLRRTLEPGRQARSPSTVLVTEGPGYALRTAPESVDSQTFTRLATEVSSALSEGEPAKAVRLGEEALALWRGPAYADCADAPFAVAEAARLEQLRDAVRTDRVAALLALGHDEHAIAEIEPLTVEQPLHERGWELYALALYRSGRQGDALAAIRTVKAHLSSQLGVDPGPGLRRLEAALLAQSPELQRDQSPTTPPRALPRPLTSFVGRRRELAQVRELLAAHRLVTLAGPGGVGKTRLALAAADGYAGERVFVDLSGVAEGELVASAIATAAGMASPGSVEALAGALSTRGVLLVLDNCEHLVEPVAWVVAALLAGTESVRVLATSREELGIAGEVSYHVPPLDPTTDAVELFRERATSVVPGWSPGPGELATIARISADLDGLPLAIELAAAQCRMLSVQQVSALLDDRFALLRSSSRTAQDRHRSLEAAVESSYEGLDEEQRRTFCALGVFEGGFDLAAARSVTGEEYVLRTLTALVGKSLVTVVRDSDPRRYRILETLRQYVAARLPQQQRHAREVAHLEWFHALTEATDVGLRGKGAGDWLRTLDSELPNARAAMSFALSESAPPGAAVLGLRIASNLLVYWYRRGNAAEGVRWLQRALDAAPDADPQVAARGLLALSMLQYLDGSIQRDLGDQLRRVVCLAKDSGDGPVLALATAYSAYHAAFQADLTAARRLSARGISLARECQQPWVLADALMVHGQVLRLANDSGGATAALEEAVTVARACGHEWAAGSALWIAAKVALDADDPSTAIERLRLAIRLNEPEGDVTSTLVGLHTLARALAVAGQAQEGALLLGGCAAVGERIGFFPERMDPVDAPSDVAAVRERLGEAEFERAYLAGRALDLAAMVGRRSVTG